MHPGGRQTSLSSRIETRASSLPKSRVFSAPDHPPGVPLAAYGRPSHERITGDLMALTLTPHPSTTPLSPPSRRDHSAGIQNVGQR